MKAIDKNGLHLIKIRGIWLAITGKKASDRLYQQITPEKCATYTLKAVTLPWLYISQVLRNI